MCGIAGIVSFDEPIDRSLLKKMTDVIAHRGPDDEGIYISRQFVINERKCQVGLGHRRLSIIDLSPDGHQPMCNEDGEIWIAYNGEVYNFFDYKRELKSKDHTFKSRTDTEVVIHLYEEYGVQCLSKMNGMWGFAIWDGRNKQLFLSRDRAGKKPIYYYYDKNRFVFASEMKAIVQDRLISREINDSALLNYLTYGYIPSPETIFKNIYKLNPGSYILIDLSKPLNHDRIRQIKYWDIVFEPDYSVPEKKWIAELRELLFDAVKIRLVSDAPLGAFLSGGMDSSIVVAIMAKLMKEPVKTFSIGFHEKEYSELEYAKIVALAYDTDHIEETVTPDALELLPELAWQYDEPFADSSAMPTYYVSKLARKKVKVVLSGDGGDELFGGYPRYSQLKNLLSYDQIPHILKKGLKGISNLLPEGFRGKWRLLQLGIYSAERYFRGISQFSPEWIKELLHDSPFEEQLPIGIPPFSDVEHKEFISSFMEFDFKQYLPHDILTKVDKASMKTSLEVRVPLLDYRIIELAARIPIKYKINNHGVTKYILKKAFADFLPSKISSERKMGFGIPIKFWFKNEAIDYIRNALLSENSFSLDFFNRSAIHKIVKDGCSNKRKLNYHTPLWNLLFLENWFNNYMRGSI